MKLYGISMGSVNKCWQVEAGSDESWKIMLCKGGISLYYEIVAKDNKKEYVVDAFVKAKLKGYIDELMVMYMLQCRDWIGIIGIQGKYMGIIIGDYEKEECMEKLMGIAGEVLKRLNSL